MRTHSQFMELVGRLGKMQAEHKFVQYISHKQGLDYPEVMLYDKQQLQDIKRFCCIENGSVLGIGNTFNIGEFLVTPTVYEDRSVVNRSTNKHPICLGPTFIHQKQDVFAYLSFCSAISYMLGDINNDPDDIHMTIGLNGNRLKKYLGRFLRECSQVICVSKLKERTYRYLKTKTRYPIRERDQILEAIYGEEGLLENPDIDTFTPLLEQLKKTIAELDSKSRGKKFLTYFETNLLPNLTEYVIEPIRRGILQRPWTYKECVEASRLLTTGVKFNCDDIPEFITKLYSVVDDHQGERCYAITDEGSLRVSDEFAKYRSDTAHWNSLTRAEAIEWVKSFHTDSGKPDNSKTGTQDVAYTPSL